MAEGFLAIWSDVEAARETDYQHWLTREHAAERLGVPGFLSVRVFRADLTGAGRYLIVYRLREPGVLASEAYLARLNAPTAWSRRIMPTLGNFARGGGRIVAEAGLGAGAFALPVRLPEAGSAIGELERLAARDGVVAARLFEVDRGGTDIATNEKAIRAGDASFAALLLVEALSPGALEAVVGEACALAPGATFEPYRQVFALG